MTQKDSHSRRDETLALLVKLGIKEKSTVFEEFDLGSLPDEGDQVARQVAKHIFERVDSFVAVLGGLLQPDTSLAALNECGFFSEEETGRVVKLYRRLMRLLRTYTLADLEGRQASYERFILHAVDSWLKEKTELAAMLARLHEGWSKEQPLQREKGYFG